MAISIQQNLSCCGVSEIQGLNGYTSAAEAMKDLCRTNFNKYSKTVHLTGAFVVFSTVEAIPKNEDNYEEYVFTIGEAFAKYIVKNRLGVVKDCGKRINRNSSNTLHVWVWSPHMKVLNLWWTRHKGKGV